MGEFSDLIGQAMFDQLPAYATAEDDIVVFEPGYAGDTVIEVVRSLLVEHPEWVEELYPGFVERPAHIAGETR